MSIVAAATLLLVGYIGYCEHARQRDINEVQQAFQSLAHVGQQAMAQSAAQARAMRARQAYESRLANARAAAEASRHDLAPDQRCVDGVVIEVHGNVYTQIGGIARPIRCVGRRADRPLR